MQIRTGDDILSQYGSPSRPISLTSLAAPPNPKKTTTTAGNEPGEIDNQTTATGLQLKPESHPQQQQSAILLPVIPPELIDHIIDHLHNDKQSLIQCSMASRAFSHATSYHLFGTVRVLSVRRCVQLQEFVRSSLHSLPSTSTTPHTSSSSTPTSPPTLRTAHYHSTQTNPHSNPTNANSHTYHPYTSGCDVSAAGWDISRFVRRIEFHRLDPQSPIEEYVSEAVKLVRMLPRIREVVFESWLQANGLEQIGQAFVTTSAAVGHHCPPANSSSSGSARAEQILSRSPLKLHLELVDFDSARAFLDFLGSFGGRLRELSLVGVGLGGGGGNGKDGIEGRCLPGLESVHLGYDAVVRPNEFGEDGPTMGAMMNMNVLFGNPAFDKKTLNVCEILEVTAPNVSELQLFRDETSELCMGLYPEASVLRLPRFRRLKSVTMHAPGPRWSDLIYDIAAWFARDEKLTGVIADPTCHDGYASRSLSVTPSLPSTASATRAERWGDWKRTRIRFGYPVREGDVDWRKLENAVLGEDRDGGHDFAGYGKHGRGIERESQGGSEGDHVDRMLMSINEHRAGGGYSRRSMVSSLWVEVGNGSASLGEVRGNLGRLDELGLLQVSRG